MNSGDKGWSFVRGAGHISIPTFQQLIEKAKTNPDYGTFENAFDNINFVKV
jgi:hypothetical protein